MYLSFNGTIREEYDSAVVATLLRKGWVQVSQGNAGLQWFVHTDFRCARVESQNEISITLSIYDSFEAMRLQQTLIQNVLIDSVQPDYEDACNEATVYLGAGWTRFKDGAVYVGDQNKARVIPQVAQRWAIRAAMTNGQLTAAASYITGLSNPKKGYYTEFWNGALDIKRTSRFIKDLVTAGVATPAGMNTIFLNAVTLTVKSVA